MVDVRPGVGSEALDLAPAAAFERDSEQIPVDALGIARGVVDLLRPHEPRPAAAVDRDLRHPNVAGDTGDGKECGPSAIAPRARANLIVEPAIAGPHGPDD